MSISSENKIAFTFASSEVNKISQQFIKIAELLTGKIKLKKLYDQYLLENNPPENLGETYENKTNKSPENLEGNAIQKSEKIKNTDVKINYVNNIGEWSHQYPDEIYSNKSYYSIGDTINYGFNLNKAVIVKLILEKSLPGFHEIEIRILKNNKIKKTSTSFISKD